ncbi:MAG: M81 family metallopeptidase [Chloroflexi bacterium]|nr:M81 family metallopeptidase [Chloroflexota bacterium]
MKIAAGGISIESATFSPLLTELSDFRVLRGAELYARYPFVSDFSEIEFTPLMHANAVPGGVVRRSAYEALKRDFLAGLTAGAPWDGVILDMHGAMAVEGSDDAEADFIGAVRALVGPDCLISASYDLHGNLSAAIMQQLDLISAYRTAPHEDALETRQRALSLLLQCLQEGRRPHKAFVRIPLLLSGERTETRVEPGRTVYARIPQLIDGDAVLDASLLVGFTWADQARSQAAAVALGWDEAATWSAARTLAQAYWDARHEFDFGVPTGSVDDCINMALAAVESTVFLSDSGDNITAGAAGDSPYVLECMLAHKVPRSLFAGITDAEAVAACFAAGAGARLTLSLGGKLDPVHGQPLEVSGIVQRAHESPDYGRQAILAVDNIDVILSERRMGFTSMARFSALDIDPLAYKIVCLKLGYLVPDFQRIAPLAIMALSPGAVYALPETLPFHNLKRPIHPFDRDMRWSP